jgi:hypothetical protein
MSARLNKLLFVAFAWGLIGCSVVYLPGPEKTTSTSSATPEIEIPHIDTSTASIPQNTQIFSMTPTSIFTVNPGNADEQFRYLLQTNGDCRFPCFWGIQPGRTSYDELYALFYQLDEVGNDIRTGEHLYVSSTVRLEERGGLYVAIKADVQEEVVRNVVVGMDGLWRPEVNAQDWAAYALDELLRVYGPPASIELYLDLPNNILAFGMRLKYEDLDASILYDGNQAANSEILGSEFATICPQGHVSDIKIHLGKNPFDYEPGGVPLASATDLNVESFHKLFTENPSSCFIVNLAAMGWGNG